MCVCMYVCMYVCVCVLMYIRMHVLMHTETPGSPRTCLQSRPREHAHSDLVFLSLTSLIKSPTPHSSAPVLISLDVLCAGGACACTHFWGIQACITCRIVTGQTLVFDTKAELENVWQRCARLLTALGGDSGSFCYTISAGMSKGDIIEPTSRGSMPCPLQQQCLFSLFQADVHVENSVKEPY
jgi:hypothetical protein